MTTEDVRPTTEELFEAAASWRFLHDLFRLPGPDQWSWLQDPRVAEAWRILAAEVPGLPSELPLPPDVSEYEQTWISTFDVGIGRVPCPLNESAWKKNAAAAGIIHENVLFYRAFGLDLRSATNDLPDHLRHQLEFVAHLCHLEAGALERGDLDQAAQVAHGREDYVARHPGQWLPTAAAALGESLPGSWPAAWMALVAWMAGPLPANVE